MKTMVQTLILMVASVSLFVACGKKSDGGGGVDPQPPVNTCTVGYPQPAGFQCVNGILQPVGNGLGNGNLLNNVQFQSSYLQGVVVLSALNLNPQPGMAMDWYNSQQAVYYYNGQVQVSGQLQVLTQTLCNAPMGAYSVQGTGNIMGGSISNLNLTVSGPTQMQLMVYSAVVYNPKGLQRDSGDNRLGILGAMLTVNGMPCGTVTTY